MQPDPYDILDHWLSHTPYAEVTRGHYRREITQWINDIGPSRVWAARPRDVAQWAASDSQRTTAWRISCLDSYYTHAHDCDRRLANPVHPGMRPDVTNLDPGRRRLTPAETATYLSALDRYTGPQPHRARALGYLTIGMGLRAFQSTALDLDDLVREQQRVTLAIPLKGGGRSPRTQLVPVPAPVLLAVEEYLPHRITRTPHSTPETGPLLTSGRGKRLDTHPTIRTILRDVAASHPLLAETAPHITADGLAASPCPFT
jgi:site-specific recombinase XerD